LIAAAAAVADAARGSDRAPAVGRYVDVDDALLQRITAAIRAPGKPKVLDIGCGNSTLVQRLSTARWDVTGIDYSPAVISRMQSIYPDHAHKYLVGDCSSMRFKTASFHAAIDKGTIDGMLQHADKDPRARRHARRVMHEVARVLKPSATLVSISINSPEKMRVALGEADWDVGEAETWAQPNPNSDTPIAVYMHRLTRRKAN